MGRIDQIARDCVKRYRLRTERASTGPIPATSLNHLHAQSAHIAQGRRSPEGNKRRRCRRPGDHVRLCHVNETDALMPAPIQFMPISHPAPPGRGSEIRCRNRRLRPDAKSQLSVRYVKMGNRPSVTSIVLSTQHLRASSQTSRRHSRDRRALYSRGAAGWLAVVQEHRMVGEPDGHLRDRRTGWGRRA